MNRIYQTNCENVVILSGTEIKRMIGVWTGMNRSRYMESDGGGIITIENSIDSINNVD